MTNIEELVENIVEELFDRGYDVTNYAVTDDERVIIEFEQFGIIGKMTIPVRMLSLV